MPSEHSYAQYALFGAFLCIFLFSSAILHMSIFKHFNMLFDYDCFMMLINNNNNNNNSNIHSTTH